MTAITFSFDDAQLKRALNSLKSAMDDMYPVMDKIGDALQNEIRLQLGQGETPWGEPFEPLKRPRKSGRWRERPLNDTRTHIYDRITHNADRDSVSIGMNENEDIGAIHQFGGTTHHAEQSRLQGFKVNMKTGRSRFARTGKANFEQWTSRGAYDVDIPARPFLPIRNGQVDLPPAWAAEVEKRIKAALTEALKV